MDQLNAPIWPTEDDLADIAKVIVGTALTAILIALAGGISRKYQTTLFLFTATVLFFWLAYRRRVNESE